MAKMIEQDGRFYRERRGKLVEIPPEWVGKHPTRKTIRQRPSKMIGKLRRAAPSGYGSKWPAKKGSDHKVADRMACRAPISTEEP